MRSPFRELRSGFILLRYVIIKASGQGLISNISKTGVSVAGGPLSGGGIPRTKGVRSIN